MPWKVDTDGKKRLITPASLRERTRRLRQRGNRELANAEALLAGWDDGGFVSDAAKAKAEKALERAESIVAQLGGPYARPSPPSARNLEILNRRLRGETYASISRDYGLSPNRIAQIAHKAALSRLQLAPDDRQMAEDFQAIFRLSQFAEAH